MKKLLLGAVALLSALSAFADNTATTVSQVTSAITLSDDVDYHITSTEPFTTTGSINITNTDHAVVIIDALRPSLAKSWLGYITINGKAAKSGSNCQLKIYNRGTLILPYGDSTQPLTVYSEKNFQGESCNDFGLENTGGYMNTMTDAQLNNRVQSFKLKRGYMVTFSTGVSGRGYSRCFVAAYADIEMNLPSILANRVSSYRVFKWNDTSKAGLANDTRAESNSALNTQWCYSFGLGEDRGEDCECVPHHIYEDWPSASACGGVTYSPNMKTNNEPGNSSDDHPQDVETVLNNWQNLMRTGMRLCSPSSHDGSLNWMKEFIDSIDARGWRCDIVDLHCYWTEWQYNNITNFYNSYKRPIWVSEFLWGASWNNNGVFASSDPDNENATVMKRILTNMNGMKYVERYAYWNSEGKGKIYQEGKLTPTGEYYATMETGLGYNKSYDYVPKNWRVDPPYNLNADFLPTKSVCKLSWKDDGGEFVESIIIERRNGSKGEWEAIGTVDPSETSTSFSYNDTITASGSYAYRIHTIDYQNKNHYSSLAFNVVAGTEGDANVQYGTITAQTTEENYAYFAEPFEEQPAIVFGSPSNLNATLSPCENMMSITKNNGTYNFFKFRYFPWTLSGVQTFAKGAEISSYIVAKQGNGKLGSLAYEAGYVKEDGKEVSVKNDTVEYTFDQPFNSVPVVLTTPRYTATTYPLMWRVWDVTEKGFKVILQRQKGLDSKYSGFAGQRVAYFAIEKGETIDGNGKKIIVGETLMNFKSKTSTYKVAFPDTLTNPMFLAQMQTFNRKVAALLRTRANGPLPSYTMLRINVDSTDTDNNTVTSKNPIEENVGWVIIADTSDSETTVIQTATIEGKLTILAYDDEAIGVKDPTARKCELYDAKGRKLQEQPMSEGQTTLNVSSVPSGVYIVRTDANHTAKFVKR